MKKRNSVPSHRCSRSNRVLFLSFSAVQACREAHAQRVFQSYLRLYFTEGG